MTSPWDKTVFGHFWPTVKGDIVAIFNNLFVDHMVMDRVNYAQVVLIPKKDNIRTVGDYRPISLVNYYLNIIPKFLASELMSVLQKMIGDYQTGLIQGRYILDSVAMAQEVIQDCNKRKVDGILVVNEKLMEF